MSAVPDFQIDIAAVEGLDMIVATGVAAAGAGEGHFVGAVEGFQVHLEPDEAFSFGNDLQKIIKATDFLQVVVVVCQVVGQVEKPFASQLIISNSKHKADLAANLLRKNRRNNSKNTINIAVFRILMWRTQQFGA